MAQWIEDKVLHIDIGLVENVQAIDIGLAKDTRIVDIELTESSQVIDIGLIEDSRLIDIEFTESSQGFEIELFGGGSGLLPYYTGEYVVDPRKVEQVLETKNKSMRDDVTVKPIFYAETSNISGGLTAVIGLE